jgi:hypothetical protein
MAEEKATLLSKIAELENTVATAQSAGQEQATSGQAEQQAATIV